MAVCTAGVLRGLVIPQALPCIVAAHVLHPQPGSRVLDMCAAPGGKTTMIAQLVGGRGQVVALDRTDNKVEQIRRMAADLGINCVTAVKMDATSALADGSGSSGGSGTAGHAADGLRDQSVNATKIWTPESPESARSGVGVPGSDPLLYDAALARNDDGVHSTEGFAPESFDHIMLDPPCSALGLGPRLTQDWQYPQLQKLAAYQRALLNTAVKLLKPGGTLVYCTCTINPLENESNVKYCLEKWPCLQLVPQQLVLGQPGLACVGGSAAEGFERHLTLQEAEMVQRFYPDDEHDTMGFFIAKFAKKTESRTLNGCQ